MNIKDTVYNKDAICPRCGHITLDWINCLYDGEMHTVLLQCTHCGLNIKEHYKFEYQEYILEETENERI